MIVPTVKEKHLIENGGNINELLGTFEALLEFLISENSLVYSENQLKIKN